MSVRRHLGFGSTPNFNNLYVEVLKNTDNKGRLLYANYDPSLGEPPTEEQVELLKTYTPTMPILTFTGSEKLHGENMAVCYSQGELWVQGRNHIRTILGDQNGMALFVETTKSTWMQLIADITNLHKISTHTHTIVIDCEWAGGNIQKGNAACSGTDKGAYIFDYFRVVCNKTDESETFTTSNLNTYPDNSIYLMSHFGFYETTLDFNNPTECEEKLKVLAESIENSSPIAKFHNKSANVGEGVYLYGTDGTIVYRLKAKGEKHGGKPKQPREQSPISDEHAATLIALAETVTPVWRLTQAITDTNATEMKHLGEVIKWVIADIAKEETPTLVEAQVELKDLSRYVSSIVKTYYQDHLKAY
jgi:hypothetical protein